MRIIHKEVSPVNSRSDIWSLSEMNIFRETRWFSWLEVSSERLMLEDEASIESKKVSVNSKVKALMLEIFDAERKLRVWRQDWMEKPLVASNNWRIGRIATPSHAFLQVASKNSECSMGWKCSISISIYPRQSWNILKKTQEVYCPNISSESFIEEFRAM